MTDPLDAIRARWPRPAGLDIATAPRAIADLYRLIDLVDRLQMRVTFREQTIEDLRGLLGRLEWAGTYCERDREMAACPVCDVVADSPVVGQQPHASDCWLAAVLRPIGDPPEGERP